MFSKHEDTTSAELTVLPDELLDKVAGGAGGGSGNHGNPAPGTEPTFYEWTSSDGTEVACLPSWVQPKGMTSTGEKCPPA